MRARKILSTPLVRKKPTHETGGIDSVCHLGHDEVPSSPPAIRKTVSSSSSPKSSPVSNCKLSTSFSSEASPLSLSRTCSLDPPPSSPIWVHLQEIFDLCKSLTSGSLADYIPELAKADGRLFSACLVTVDGFVYEMGDSSHEFTIQSISKPFVYGLALQDHGVDKVNEVVGVKPSGDSFNSIIFDENNNRPFNPMVNAGAIATTSLVKGNGRDERFDRILKLFEAFAGKNLDVDEAVYQSESRTGHRNRAIAYLELSNGMIEGDISEHLDVYFRQCAIKVTAKDLAVMAGTLANKGKNPLTSDTVIDTPEVTSILSVMTSCGMYDFSGDWLYKVGIPAKSGVAGGIIAVLPGQFGIGVFSPLLDSYGNSVRGIRFCEELSKKFNLHTFNLHPLSSLCVERMYTAATVSSRSQRRLDERQILDEHGHDVIIKELKGDLFFASMDRLIRNLDAEHYAQFVILDWTKVGRVDNMALKLLVNLGDWYKEKQAKLFFSGCPDPIVAQLKATGWMFDDAFYPNLDEALEYCEERILIQVRGPKGNIEELDLGEMDFFFDFEEEEVEIVKKLCERIEYEDGEMIIRKGDDSTCVFFLAKGTATVTAPAKEGKKGPRLVTYIPGVSFGDMALFDMGQRTANVVAACSGVVCLVLKVETLEQMEPKIYSKILKEAGRSIALLLKRK